MEIDYENDYYADLEMSPTGDVEEIKRQYHTLLKKYGPEGHSDNPLESMEAIKCFNTIKFAYKILTSPEQKAEYDHRRGEIGGSAAAKSSASHASSRKSQLHLPGPRSSTHRNKPSGMGPWAHFDPFYLPVKTVPPVKIVRYLNATYDFPDLSHCRTAKFICDWQIPEALEEMVCQNQTQMHIMNLLADHIVLIAQQPPSSATELGIEATTLMDQLRRIAGQPGENLLRDIVQSIVGK